MGNALTKKGRQQVSLSRRTGGTELNLSECEIRKIGSFKSIIKLKLLVKLNLSHNYLQAIPGTVKKLVNLEELDISYNEVHELPYEIYLLTNLRVLLVEGNGMKGLPIPTQLSRLTNLQVLSLAGNRILSLPHDFGQLRLTHLDLSRNSLKDLFPEVYQVKTLTNLNVSGNHDFQLPDRIGELNLEVLDMSDCQMKSLPASIGQLTNLTCFKMQKNRLTTLPDEIVNLRKLREWNMQLNELGNLDNLNLSGFTELEEIYFAHNRITKFPRGLGRCKKLRILDLSHNQLTTINREVGWLHATMRKLLLGNNKIKALPGELSYLNPAIEIDLSNNPLGSPFIQWYQVSIITLMENLKPFLRSYPEYCYVFGDSSARTVVGQPTTFFIQGIDYQGQQRLNGGDEFEAHLKGEKNGETYVNKLVVKDNQDGTYSVFFNSMVSGKMQLFISESGESIKNSPMDYYVAPAPLDMQECRVVGLEGPWRVGTQCSFTVEARDRFGNICDTIDDPLRVAVQAPNGNAARLPCQPISPGIYTVNFTPGFPGVYAVHVLLDKTPLPDSPFRIEVLS